MIKKMRQSKTNNTIEHRLESSQSFLKSDWPMIICVTMIVIMIVYSVLYHAKDKPDTPQALAAAAFKQVQGIQEWGPGMGPQPLISKPVAFNPIPEILEWRPGLGAQPLISKPADLEKPVWKTLYYCPNHGPQIPMFDVNNRPHCPVDKQIMMVNP